MAGGQRRGRTTTLYEVKGPVTLLAMAIKNLELTTAEKKLLQEWLVYEEKHGATPSRRYLAQRLGVAVNSVQHAVRMLQTKGYLKEKRVTLTRLTPNAKAKKAL